MVKKKKMVFQFSEYSPLMHLFFRLFFLVWRKTVDRSFITRYTSAKSTFPNVFSGTQIPKSVSKLQANEETLGKISLRHAELNVVRELYYMWNFPESLICKATCDLS